MSTKTSIKRIALVAVVSLGFGMVTSLSANAGDAANAAAITALTEEASVKVTAIRDYLRIVF